jgi:hypothetical protein
MDAAHCRMMNDVDLALTDERFCDFQRQRLPSKISNNKLKLPKPFRYVRRLYVDYFQIR